MKVRLTDTGEVLTAGAWLPESVLDADLSHLAVRLYALLALYAAQGLPRPPARILANRLHCGVQELQEAVRELGRLRPLPRWMHRGEEVPAG